MGSTRFCEDQAAERGFQAAVIMDLVGHDFALDWPGLANLVVATGVESSGALPALVDGCPHQLPLVVAHNDVVGDMSDHHAFRLRGVPYLETAFGPHLRTVLTKLGIVELRARADLDRLAFGLQALGV